MKKMIESQNVIHVAGNTWCLNTVASIPIYFIDDRNVILLDTGYSDDRSRPALMEFLEENELKVSAILGTHTHYDHVGNHNYLKTRYGSEIIMPELEAALGANYQMLSPVYWQYTRRELENGPRIFSRNVYYAIKYLAQIGFMESYIVDGVVHYRVSR